MSALKPGRGNVGSVHAAAPAISHAGDTYVLPRPLRRPARFARRLVSGEVEMPRHAFAVMAATFLCATAAYGSVLGGHVPAIVQTVASGTGFADAFQFGAHLPRWPSPETRKPPRST